MLQITQEQMDALNALHLNRFKTRLVQHLDEHFPGHLRALASAERAEFLDHGIAEANAFDLKSEQDICIFFNIKMLLNVRGPFNSEAHGWVINILNDKQNGEPSERLAHLGAQVDAYLDAHRKI
ncbi:MAG TPA: hypothetical protein VIM41_17380 [Gammaproteobacteria bacterium]